jgi:enoyl-CoA hydratase/carnithine racemase
VTGHYDEEIGDAAGQLAVVVEDGVAVVTLTRPDKHNAISFAMWQAFTRLMPALSADDDVDAVIVGGTAGGPFSAGADIAEFRTLRADVEGATAYGAAVTGGERAIIHCSKPTIAAIEGFAIGGGTQIAVACDLRLCGADSRFAVTPSRLGIVYALPSTERLVETVGAAWARWILLTGEQLDAESALRIGLVHEVVDPDQVRARADELAATLAARARVSLRGAKLLIDRVTSGRLDEDDDVRRIYHDSLMGPEYAEGVAAFLEKRPARFADARRSQRRS